jgi:hypothetical protein
VTSDPSNSVCLQTFHTANKSLAVLALFGRVTVPQRFIFVDTQFLSHTTFRLSILLSSKNQPIQGIAMHGHYCVGLHQLATAPEIY